MVTRASYAPNVSHIQHVDDPVKGAACAAKTEVYNLRAIAPTNAVTLQQHIPRCSRTLWHHHSTPTLVGTSNSITDAPPTPFTSATIGKNPFLITHSARVASLMGAVRDGLNTTVITDMDLRANSPLPTHSRRDTELSNRRNTQ